MKREHWILMYLVLRTIILFPILVCIEPLIREHERRPLPDVDYRGG